MKGKSLHVRIAAALRRPLGDRLFKTPPSGQGMTEYIIIVAVVSVAAIGVYSLLGQTIRNQAAGVAQEIAGNDGGSAIGAASQTANTARIQANTAKNLRNYNEDNRQ